jgi:small subunit ribosomal protein S13
MANIFGTFILDKKKVEIGLTSIYGIGALKAKNICNRIGITPKTRIGDLQQQQFLRLRKLIQQNFLIGKDLKKTTVLNIHSYIQLNNYKGSRHRMGLPVNGQRTHTNAKTQKKLSRKHIND